MRAWLSFLTSTFLVVESHVTFHEVASHLEETFDQVDGGGACAAGTILRILEGEQDAHCEAFTNIRSAIGEADGDILKASKSLILQSVEIEGRYSELLPIKHELIDETHAKYKFMNFEKRDQYWCMKQNIVQDKDKGGSSGLLSVNETSGVIIGTRSEPTCIEERVADVIETVDKFHLMDEKELHLAVNWDEVTRVVEGSAISPPTSSISGNESYKNTILIAVSCLILAVVIPISVFLLRFSKRHRNAASPTQISEWLVSSINNDDADNIAHTLELS